MKKLLAKIRKLLRDRRTRRIITRFVSVTAAIVVFVTTYALVLPAITMESEAYCGIPAHQHDDSCYELQLICEKPETEGHAHTDECYSVSQVLTCEKEEHQHSVDNGCYDEEGNLVCTKAEHTHSVDDGCYEEERVLVCEEEESEGHQHGEQCYEKVLTCGKEVHTHSTDCYINPAEGTTTEAAVEVSSGGASTGAAAASTGASSSPSVSVEDNDTEDAETGATEGTDTALTTVENATAGVTADGSYIPQLEPVDFTRVLNKNTGIYYHPVADGEVVEDSTQIGYDGWMRVDKNTELGTADLLRVYLSYSIPAGSLNATNQVARYRIPANLHLSDAQVNAINTNINGIAGQYVNMDTLEILDVDKYYAYLGVEAVEGTRRPDEDPNEYLQELSRRTGTDAAEYISALVRVENVYDEQTGEYLGQDLVFTWTPFSIEKNQHEYDSTGQPTKAGQEIDGWVTLDFNMSQVDLVETAVDTFEREVDAETAVEEQTAESPAVDDRSVENDDADATVNVEAGEAGKAAEEDETGSAAATVETVEHREKIAEIVFVEEGRDEENHKIHEISTTLTVVEETVVDFHTVEDQDAVDNQDAENTGEGATDDATAATTGEATVEDQEQEGESSTGDTSASAEEDKTEAGAEPVVIMPAMSFNDTITVRTGKPADIDEGGTVANAADSLPEEAEVTVRVEADEGTFPAGTTMKLAAVDQETLDGLADTLAETVENPTSAIASSESTMSSDDVKAGEPKQADSTDTAVDDHSVENDAQSGEQSEATETAENTEDQQSENTKEEQKNLKTYGFQAVDITFVDADGNEVEPAKPVRVALTSETVQQAKRDAENSAVTDPVVVHVDDEGKAEQMDLVDPEEIEPAVGRSEEEIEREMEAEKTAESDASDATDEADTGSTADEKQEDDNAASDATVDDHTGDETDNTVDNNADTTDATAVDELLNAGDSENAVDSSTVGFTTDSFSVYAIVYTVELYTNIITDSGETYRITVTYDETSGIPQDAELRVSEIKEGDEGYENYYAEAVKAASDSLSAQNNENTEEDVDETGDMGAVANAIAQAAQDAVQTITEENVENEGEGDGTEENEDETIEDAEAAYARFFDIEIWANGQKVEPTADVSVSIRLLDVPEKDDKNIIKIVHFDTDGPEVISHTETREDDSDGSNRSEDAVNTEVGNSEAENTEEEQEKATGAAEFTFTTSTFSVYSVVSYTVDFHWVVNGKEYTFCLPGGGYVTLQQLVEVLGIARTPDADATLDEAESSESAKDDALSTPDSEHVEDEASVNDAAHDSTEEIDAAGTEAETAETEAETEAVEESGEGAEEARTLTLKDVVISDETRVFVANVASIEFSTPSLLWIGKVNEPSTVGKIKEAQGLDVQYSVELTEEQITEINTSEVESGDWALISMQPFDTEEMLTVTMKDGEQWVIRVTDAKDAVMNYDGQTVQTIPNPSGTTITMFDYWIDYEDYVARRGWPGYDRTKDGTTFDWVGDGTNGNNTGINKDHKLKFVPGNGGKVYDYDVRTGNRTPDSSHYSSDGNVNGINSWNGQWDSSQNRSHFNGEPTLGIVADALYNSSGQVDENGFPKLALGSNPTGANAESLAYLFDPNVSHAQKKTYTYADNLFYVDPDGYYKYDSLDYKATMNKATSQFTVREQPTNDNTEGINGFWPMGDLNYWFGMHLRSEFSIPADGEVLNPNGEYKPMQFEFAGDDDAWAYIDGILVADGGGLHNRTKLTINYQTGRVQVLGGYYWDLSNPDETVVVSKTLYEIFLDALNNNLITQDKFNSYNWKDYDGDGTPDTFGTGVYPTFDFFYLERGGSESNLYIKYNLVSTENFSAHKAIDASDDVRLLRDAYKFELIGLGNEYVPGTSMTNSVIMPKEGWQIVNGAITGTKTEGAGTFTDPKMIYSEEAYTDSQGNTHAGYILTTGVSENGDVRFGMADIDPQLLQGDTSEHKYIVREIVPDDAVNADGIKWADATAAQKAAGGFVKDDIYYDGRVYYMKCEVTSWNNGTEHGLSKTYYTDDTFTTVDSSSPFIDFRNKYMNPLAMKVTKKDEDDNRLLQDVEFTLSRVHYDEETQKWVKTEGVTPIVKTTNAQGMIEFDDLTLGNYILEESKGLSGYLDAENKWLVRLVKQEKQVVKNGKTITVYELKPTVMKIALDGSEIPGVTAQDKEVVDGTFEQEILNEKLQNASVQVTKKWLRADGTTAYTPGEGDPEKDATVTGELWRKYKVNVTNPTVTILASANSYWRDNNIYTTIFNSQVNYDGSVKFAVYSQRPYYNNTRNENPSFRVSTGQNIVTSNENNGNYNQYWTKAFTLNNIRTNTTIYVDFNVDYGDIYYNVLSYSSPSTATQEEHEEAVNVPNANPSSTTFTLNKDNGWTVTWPHADLNEVAGRNYEYFLKNINETGADGFTFISTPEVTKSVSGTNGLITMSLKNIKNGNLTDLIARKVWTDSKDHSSDTIRYKIQRSEYDADGTLKKGPYDYVAIGQASHTEFTLQSTDQYNGMSWQRYHGGLPADNGLELDDSEYREYRYSILETSMLSAYEVSYSDLTQDGKTIKVIKNTPADKKLGVEKKWISAEGGELTSDLPEGAYITGTLKRNYEYTDATGVRVNVYFRTWSGGAVNESHLYRSYVNVQSGSTFSLWAVDTNGKEPNNGVSVGGTTLPQDGAEKTFVISSSLTKKTKAFRTTITGSAGGSIDIICDWQFNTGYNQGIYYDVNYTQAPDVGQHHEGTETVGTFRLDATNGWTMVWTDDDINEAADGTYSYYIDSVKEYNAAGQEVANYDGFKAPVIPNNGALTNVNGVLTGTIINSQEKAGINLKKTDESGDILPGAVFDLKVLNGNNVYQAVTQIESETDYSGIRFNSGKTDAEDVALAETVIGAKPGVEGSGTHYYATFTTPTYTEAEQANNPLMTLKNLPDGSYQLIEVDAPDGYVLTLSPIEFTVSSGVVTYANSDNNTANGTKVQYTAAEDETLALLTVANEPGVELPNSGGPGTRFIYLAGALLTLLGAVMLMGKKIRA